MKKIFPMPIKVVDNFLEAPDLWRHYALKQEFSRDDLAPWPGEQSKLLNELNPNLFGSLASKLIKHVHGCKSFQFLKVNFTLVDESYTMGWLHQDEPHYNVAGVIYLNPVPADDSGTVFYNQSAPFTEDFKNVFHEELTASAKDRPSYARYKEQQRSFFKQDTVVENEYNRCVMFDPHHWHSVNRFFGNSKDTSRLTINFFGIAV